MTVGWSRNDPARCRVATLSGYVLYNEGLLQLRRKHRADQTRCDVNRPAGWESYDNAYWPGRIGLSLADSWEWRQRDAGCQSKKASPLQHHHADPLQ